MLINWIDPHIRSLLDHPIFFLRLASSDRPRFSRFQKKKSYAEGNEGNDTIFQILVTLIRNITKFLAYRFLVFSSYFNYRGHNTHSLTRETFCPCDRKTLKQSFFIPFCRLPSGSSCSLPLVSCRQRRIPDTQDSRPCRWLLSHR